MKKKIPISTYLNKHRDSTYLSLHSSSDFIYNASFGTERRLSGSAARCRELTARGYSVLKKHSCWKAGATVRWLQSSSLLLQSWKCIVSCMDFDLTCRSLTNLPSDSRIAYTTRRTSNRALWDGPISYSLFPLTRTGQWTLYRWKILSSGGKTALLTDQKCY